MRGDGREFKNYREYMDTVNNEIFIIIMIETVECLKKLEEIVSVPEVYVLLVGP